jgi:hypothetical protein
MTKRETQVLKEAVSLLANPRADKKRGWAALCELAGLDITQHPSPFEEPSPENPKHLPEDYAD